MTTAGRFPKVWIDDRLFYAEFERMKAAGLPIAPYYLAELLVFRGKDGHILKYQPPLEVVQYEDGTWGIIGEYG